MLIQSIAASVEVYCLISRIQKIRYMYVHVHVHVHRILLNKLFGWESAIYPLGETLLFLHIHDVMTIYNGTTSLFLYVRVHVCNCDVYEGTCPKIHVHVPEI